LEKIAGQEDPVIADALLTPESVAIVGIAKEHLVSR
jgi:hypothetical protein